VTGQKYGEAETPLSKRPSIQEFHSQKMPNPICLLTPREGELFRSGILPAGACKYHQHIDIGQALVLTGGAENYPRHDHDDLMAIAKDSRGKRCAWADWAEMPTYEGDEQIMDIEGRLRAAGFDDLGIMHELQAQWRLSKKHVVLRMAKEWTASQSWRPIGAEKRIKFGKTHLRRPIQYSLTQCADVNGTGREARI
jgi:hypothetical protein